MRKNFGEKTWIYPMPVLILGTYDEGGTPNAMNAAWGGIYDTNVVMICLAGRRRSFSTRWIIVPPQRESIKDYRRITCEKGKYLAKQPQILRNEPTSSQKTMNQTVKTMHRIALVFAMESCMKNAWNSTQTQRMQSCFFAMV